MSNYPIPDPETVASVMGDLIGKEISVAEGDSFHLGPDSPFIVVLFRDDEGFPGPVMIFDMALSIYTGAALSVLPPEEAAAAVGKNEFTEAMYDNFKEVVNIVGGTLFNGSDSPHLVLREIWVTPRKLPSELKAVFTEPSDRLDAKVNVEDYGDGKLMLLTV